MMEKLADHSPALGDIELSDEQEPEPETTETRCSTRRKNSQKSKAGNTVKGKKPQDGECKKPVDLLDCSAAGNALTALGHTSPESPGLLKPAATPAGVSQHSAQLPHPRYHLLSQQIHAIIPSRETLSALSKIPGVSFFFAIIHGPNPSQDGSPVARSEDILHVPPPTSHPALLARKLLAVCFCLQQLPYDFDMSALKSSRSAIDIMNDAMALVTREVTSNDDLLTCLEGIECLMLQGLIYSDAGLIRKAWMTGRRALSIQQLMGLDRKANLGPIRSCNPSSDPARRPPPALLWSRTIASNRHNSLVLGLPICSRDNSFATKEFPEWDLPLDKLGRKYAIIAGRVSERNEMIEQGRDKGVVYALTQAIDIELDEAAQITSDMWWERPGAIRECNESDNLMPELSTIKLQVRHFTLLLLLHLPYISRTTAIAEEQMETLYLHNRNRCMEAGRAIVRRFLDLRRPGTSITSGRSVDYAALIGGMTIVLGHARSDAGLPGPVSDVSNDEIARDMKLVEKARHVMESTGKQWGDKLATESAELLSRFIQSSKEVDGSGLPVLSSAFRPAAALGASSLLPDSMESLTQPGPALVGGTLDFLREGPTMMQADADWSWLGSSTDLHEWALPGNNSIYWTMLNQDP